MKIRYWLPIAFFVGIVAILWRGLSLNPSAVPSPLINHPAPTIRLQNLLAKQQWATNQIFLGKVSLVNVWATWCAACLVEHQNLLTLAKDFHINIVGIDYKDDEDQAKKWLAEKGNPYQMVLNDPEGQAAIDWGVYGTPETFVVDKKGIIRYKHTGPLSAEFWANILRPLLRELDQEQ